MASNLNLDLFPDELIGEVFIHYVNACDFEGQQERNKMRHVSYGARVFLCSINHRLREIAIRKPQLWAHIQIPQYPATYDPVPVIDLWVTRSGNHPLYIDLYGPWDLTCGHPGEAYGSQYVDAIMEILRPHLLRWKSFKIFFDESSAKGFSELPLETAVMLETMEVVCCPCSQELDNQLQTSIAKLPALRKLFWDKYYRQEDDRSPFEVAIHNFPWSRLSHLYLSCILSVEETLQLFSGATSVEAMRLKIRTNLSRPPNTGSQRLITLPTLRALEIFSDAFIYDVLQHLDIPNLKILWFNAQRFLHGSTPIIPCVRFKEFLNRSANSLNGLMLASFDFPETDIPQFFGNPALVNIAVFQAQLGSSPLRKVENSLKTALATRKDFPRRLIVRRDQGPFVGWVGGDTKPHYFDGFGSWRNLAWFLFLDFDRSKFL